MRGPDRNDYPMKGVFREVSAPERLVFTNIAIDKEGNHLLEGETTVTFSREQAARRPSFWKLTPSVLYRIAPQMLGGHGGRLDPEHR